MKKKSNLLVLNLRLFEGGGGGAASGGEGTGEGTATTGESNTVKPSNTRKGNRANPLAEVKYGIQDDQQEDIGTQAATEEAAQPLVTEKTLDERKAEFDRLIKTDYKDLYTEKTQEMINGRFKETKGLQSQMESLNPVLELLASKYGVDGKDLAQLTKAIQEDESFYEDEAFERGLSVEQLKQIKQMERENSDLKKSMQQQKSREEADQIYSGWMDQSEQLQGIYPSFDLESECQEPQFVSLLKSGIDVRTAYEVIHRDEVIGGAMQYTAQQTKQQVINTIKARGNRPAENGGASQGSAVVRKDVHSYTKQDRAEIQRRALRGEKIRL